MVKRTATAEQFQRRGVRAAGADDAALNTQFEAANEVLFALGRSAGDPNTVLTTVVEGACRRRVVLRLRTSTFWKAASTASSTLWASRDELVEYITTRCRWTGNR